VACGWAGTCDCWRLDGGALFSSWAFRFLAPFADVPDA
jgi:hypothetical protein